LTGSSDRPALDVDQTEALLHDWFERPVILLASGRTALRIALAEYGLTRYDDRIWVPWFLSRCVLSAVTHQAFPVECPHSASGTLLYHQYGFRVRDHPRDPVVEDIAHSFFAGPRTGRRAWRGELAIFSLPKFFPTAGFAGGLLASSEEHAAKIRSATRNTAASSATCTWMREVYQLSFPGSRRYEPGAATWLDSASELLFQYPAPDPEALAGLPSSRAEIEAVGEVRDERARRFRELFVTHDLSEFWPAEEDILPYALPFFAQAGLPALARARSALDTLGIRSDVYRVNVARSMLSPTYRPCLLVPGHQQMNDHLFAEMCDALADTA
jgi:hypothetical protein